MILSKKAAAISFAAVFFIADRLLKILVLKYSDLQPVGIFGDWLSFKSSFNQGIAFSLPLPLNLTIFLSFIILALLFGLLISSYANNKHWEFWGLSLLFAGAASNWLDRLKWSAVIDYFDFKYFTVFNLADLLIIAGIFLLILSFKKR